MLWHHALWRVSFMHKLTISAFCTVSLCRTRVRICHPFTIMSLSPYHSHPVSIAMSLTPHHWHPVSIAVFLSPPSLSPCPCSDASVTCPCHPFTVTGNMSITLSLKRSASVTPSLSPCLSRRCLCLPSLPQNASVTLSMPPCLCRRHFWNPVTVSQSLSWAPLSLRRSLPLSVAGASVTSSPSHYLCREYLCRPATNSLSLSRTYICYPFSVTSVSVTLPLSPCIRHECRGCYHCHGDSVTMS